MKKIIIGIILGLSLVGCAITNIRTVPINQVPEAGMTKSQVEKTTGINSICFKKYKVDEFKHFIERWTVYRECNPKECTYFNYKVSDDSDVFRIYFNRDGIVTDVLKK